MVMTQVMTAEEMAKGAAQWFGTLAIWPTESVEEIIIQNNAMKIANPQHYDTPSYYGVSAVLLQLMAANDGKWPPMSPRQFAIQLMDPRMVKSIARYAKNVSVVEARREGV